MGPELSPPTPNQSDLPKQDEPGDDVGARFIAPKSGEGPTPPSSPPAPPLLPASQAPKPPGYGYDKPSTVPLAQIANSPPAQNAPVEANTAPQPISAVSPQDASTEILESPQPTGGVIGQLPLPSIVPAHQMIGQPSPEMVPIVEVDNLRTENAAKARTARIGGIWTWKNIRRPHLLIALVALLVALLIIAGAITFASPGTFGRLSNVAPGITSSATITITPASKDVKSTYTIFGVTANPNQALRQVEARQLTYSTPAQSKTANATGVGHTPGVPASGTITFYNGSTIDRLVGAGTTFDLGNGLQIVTDQAVDVPPANPPAAFGTASVSAHAAEVGRGGNIPALAINEFCCSSNSGIFAKNLRAFGGGQDPQNLSVVVQQSDIDGVANPLKTMLMSAAMQSLQSQVHPTEKFINSPQCTPDVSADHSAGDQASSVTVTIKVSCSGEVYDQQGVQTIAANLLKQQAVTELGSGYTLVGSLVTGITKVQVANASKGTLEFIVNAEGIWVYQFSDAQKAMLTRLIAGKSKQAAQSLLLQQMGVANVTIQLSGGNGAMLSMDSTQIAINVVMVPGLQGT